jgi:regulation of enolase protein 1 (concanavalin A-like superfamily)
MTSTVVPWSEGTWQTPPRRTRSAGQHLIVEAVEGSDYWEKTLYGFQHDSGHALLAPWSERDASEVSFSLRGFSELYDQAGLMLWCGPERWIKAGVEMNDGVPHLGAVVTDGFSDWSLAPVPEWRDATITLRASRAGDAVILRASANGGRWRMLRVAPFRPPASVEAGPFLCAPKRSGFEVTFTRWARTERDEGLHTEPAPPKLA